MKYHFKIHKEENGYWAECVELQGCFTQAESFDSLLVNMDEALSIHLDETKDSELNFPLPDSVGNEKGIIGISVKPSIALALMLRHLRKKHNMTQKDAAEAMGFKGLFSYQRLESSKTSNPELLTLDKIKSVFTEFSIDFIIRGSEREVAHIVQIDNEWGVFEENNYRQSSVHKSKDAALRAAKNISGKNILKSHANAKIAKNNVKAIVGSSKKAAKK